MNTKTLQTKFEDHAPWVLIIFHVIGLGIFLYPDRPEGLSGGNLLLCASLIYWSSNDWRQELKLLLGIVSLGFLIECIGVHTGLLFGNYQYGNELGWKFYGVPLVLGLNWYCVIAISSHVVMKWVSPYFSLWLRALMVGVLCAFLDYFIEPVAIKYDFWTWKEGVIPMANYYCWFACSSLFAVWYLYEIKQTNSTAYFVFFVWISFFFILNLF